MAAESKTRVSEWHRPNDRSLERRRRTPYTVSEFLTVLSRLQGRANQGACERTSPGTDLDEGIRERFGERGFTMLIRRVFQSAVSIALLAHIPKAQAACSARDEVKIAALGDILVHGAIYEPANRDRSGFKSIWSSLIPLFQSADLTYGNFEAAAATGVTQGGRVVSDPGRVYDCDHPIGRDGQPDIKKNGSRAVYCTSNFLFNYHPDMITALKQSGVSVVSTANNHSLDRGRTGVDRTIEAMRERGMPFTGTRHSSLQNPWHAVTTAKGWRIAWVGCTDVANWENNQPQVLRCKSETTLELIRDLAKDRTVDAVIVTPHWGNEYATSPSSSQTSMAQKFADAGATAIVGNHPHVLQPLRIIKSADGREVPVAYSLGNFIAAQRALERKLSVILYLDLRREGGITKVVDLSAVPIVRVGLNVVPLERAMAWGMGGEENEAARILRSRMSTARLIRPSQVCQ